MPKIGPLSSNPPPKKKCSANFPGVHGSSRISETYCPSWIAKQQSLKRLWFWKQTAYCSVSCWWITKGSNCYLMFRWIRASEYGDEVKQSCTGPDCSLGKSHFCITWILLEWSAHFIPLWIYGCRWCHHAKTVKCPMKLHRKATHASKKSAKMKKYCSSTVGRQKANTIKRKKIQNEHSSRRTSPPQSSLWQPQNLKKQSSVTLAPQSIIKLHLKNTTLCSPAFKLSGKQPHHQTYPPIHPPKERMNS